MTAIVCLPLALSVPVRPVAPWNLSGTRSARGRTNQEPPRRKLQNNIRSLGERLRVADRKMRSTTGHGRPPFIVYMGDAARCHRIVESFHSRNLQADVCPYEVFVTTEGPRDVEDPVVD